MQVDTIFVISGTPQLPVCCHGDATQVHLELGFRNEPVTRIDWKSIAFFPERFLAAVLLPRVDYTVQVSCLGPEKAQTFCASPKRIRPFRLWPTTASFVPHYVWRPAALPVSDSDSLHVQ